MKSLRRQASPCHVLKQIKQYKSGSIQRKNKMDYVNYRFSAWQNIRYTLEGIGVILFIAYFFYRQIKIVPLLLPIAYLYRRDREKKKIQSLRRELAIQAKECLLSVSAGLKAGYSVENAFRESIPDMRMLFGAESMIVKEIRGICKGLDNNISLETLLHDMGARSGSKEIVEFADVFGMAKRGGGNLPEVMQNTAILIGDKIDTEQDIYILVSGKRLEQKLMSILPFGIVIYIEAGNKGYFNALYHNLSGAMVMTICLIIYLGAGYLSDKILNTIF